MAQTTGSTSPTFSNILKTKYRDFVPYIMPRRRPILGLLRKYGTEVPTKNKTIQFGMQTKLLDGLRMHGQDDPSSYGLTTGGIDFIAPTVQFRKGYFTAQLSNESYLEAGSEGALTDGVKRFLEGFADSVAHRMEILFLTQRGDGVIFKVKTTTGTAAPATIPVEKLGGIDGQEIGHIMRNLALRGVSLANTTGATGTAIRSTWGTASSFVETLGSESVTTSSLSANGATAADCVVLSDANLPVGTTYPATNYQIGLPGLVDDGTLLTTFQNITVSSYPEFQSTVLSNGGTKRPLDEDLMSKLIVSCRVRSSANTDENGYAKWVFICSETQKELFAQSLRADRRWGAPATLTLKGVKPYAGVETEALHFNGIPFFTSPLAQRNSVYLVDTEDVFIVHNGPVWGDWLTQGIDIEAGPRKQWTWQLHNNFAMDVRNTSGRIDDLTTMSGI